MELEKRQVEALVRHCHTKAERLTGRGLDNEAFRFAMLASRLEDALVEVEADVTRRAMMGDD